MMHDLSGRWKLKEAASTDALAEAGAPGQWLAAAVPGCVHLDLMKAGRIPDPFYGFNDLEVQWVAERHWLYRRSFRCPPALARMERADLVFRGLDTFAHVFLNGQQVGRADNMFREWRWDVTQLLSRGSNELLVLFESPKAVGEALLHEHGKLPIWDAESPQRAYTRKAQYASGWDWGPNLNTSGIWRAVFLEGFSQGRVSDVWAPADWSDPARPVVNVSVEIAATQSCAAKVEARLTKGRFKKSASTSARLKAGTNVVRMPLEVPRPELWWPAGFGPQNLYELTVRASLDGEELPPTSLRLGLRRAELQRERDEEGESFVIRINGEPVFCKGANWVPADSFLPRLTRKDYDALVKMAAYANMNMLRVWGGGVYEDDRFFEACDRLGIMVWHDFAFACAAYPDHLDWFCESARAEAEDNVRRLRNHPSLVFWCGNNENYLVLRQAQSQAGIKLYEQILPEVCRRLDPTRPYWPGSPYGGEDPNSPSEGDQHFWTPWHGWAHPDVQRRYKGRFIDEFGIQAPPALETIREYIPSGGHDMLSRVMEHHNRDGGGTEKLYRYLAAFFRVPCSFADTVYLMQLAQAEAVKVGVEYWRSRKFLTAGALFWQFNDCWPVTSWSCLDYKRRPKALYYYARRFFAPVLPVIDQRHGRFTVAVVNDTREEFEGELVCGFATLDGDQAWVERGGVSVPANRAAVAKVKESAELDMSDPTRHFFWCRLLGHDGEVGHNAWLLLPCKHMQLSVPEWEVKVQRAGKRRFAVRLASDTFAKGVWVDVEGTEAGFSDNFFDAFPEVPVSLTITTGTDMEVQELRRRLRIRSAADAQHRRGDRS
jgi:beta-mannosidase